MSSNNLILDEFFDSGVKLLEIASESSDECEQEQKSCDLYGIIDSGCADLSPETKEKQVSERRKYFWGNIVLVWWDELAKEFCLLFVY